MDYGLLEYSYTKGYHDTVIINFYIDQRLRSFARLKEEDRVTVFYDFIHDKGTIVVVPESSSMKKTHCPKLTLSSSSNINGKLKFWYDMNSDYRYYVLLPFNIFQEQIPLRITEVTEGKICFSSGIKTTTEEIIIALLKNFIDSGKHSDDEINTMQSEIRKIKNEILSLKRI